MAMALSAIPRPPAAVAVAQENIQDMTVVIRWEREHLLLHVRAAGGVCHLVEILTC